MPLRLQVVSKNRTSLGEAHVMEFSGRGGTIGRSLESDWPLPDRKRYLSGLHAAIDFQAGAYYLVDTSRNGVFINGANTPVGKGHPQRLFDGDRFRMGDYDIQVAIVGDDSRPTGDTISDSIVRAQLVPEDESMEMAMLEVEKITESGALEAHLHPSDSTAGLSAISEPIDTRGKTALALDEAVKVMVEALGLSPKAVAGVPPTQVLQTAGQLLREFVTGLQLLQQRQTDLLQMFNLSGSDSDSGGNNPLRFATDLGPALKYLLGSRGDSYLDSQDGVRDALSAIDMRQQAMIKAMCHALEDYLKHFDPDAVKSRVSETRKRGPRLQGSNKSRYWENYEKAFSVLTRYNEKHIPKQFAEEFARAYKIEILSLKEGDS